MTRRSVNSPEKKTEGTAGRKRKAVKPAVQPAEEQAEGSRPKRNARKSVLFTSGEYEVRFVKNFSVGKGEFEFIRDCDHGIKK